MDHFGGKYVHKLPIWPTIKDYPSGFFTSPNISFDIGIVGGGIAGLTTAIALSQCGHRVDVYERTTLNEKNIAVTIGPNAMRVLRQLDFDFVRARALILEEGNIWDGSTLRLNCRTEYSDIAREFGDPWAVIHRRDLGRELRRLASFQSPTRSSVKIHYESPVTCVDCKDGVLTLEDGSRIQKNIIIGADGVDSLVAKYIIDERVDPIAYRTTFRFVIPTDKLLQNESTRELFEGKPPALNIAVSGNKRLVWYPCRSATEQNFVALHMASRGEHSTDHANPQKYLLKEYEGFSPKILEIFRLIDNVTFETLSLQTPIKSWTKGKAVIIGNAAHFMLPHQGQCESQGIEDAGALSVFLSRVESAKDISARLMSFQKARWNRTAALQILSSVAQDQAQDEAQRIEEASVYIRGHIPRTPQEFNRYNFSYSIFSDCLDVLAME